MNPKAFFSLLVGQRKNAIDEYFLLRIEFDISTINERIYIYSYLYTLHKVKLSSKETPWKCELTAFFFNMKNHSRNVPFTWNTSKEIERYRKWPQTTGCVVVK